MRALPKLLILLFLFPVAVISQSYSSIKEKTQNLSFYSGYFNFYWDDHTGKIFIEVNKPDSEFLYQVSLPAGLGSNDVGLDRGIMGQTFVVKFTKAGNKLMLIAPNYHFRAVTNDMAEKRTVEQSFAQSILWGFPIEAESNGTYLIDATSFLLRDAMMAAQTFKEHDEGNYNVDASRSVMYMPRTKNFPFNTEFETTITFTKPDRKGGYVESVAPSENAVTLRMHHSFVKLPDNNYKPRLYDARSPFITMSYYDYSSPVSEPIEKYFILRHRLEKKDPTAAMSEAVKPIVYYLDNGTPEPIRSALFEGATWWNKAFEAAGYINAFQVRMLPDSADPMDVRYNMINWVHRSTRGWSFGGAVSDPRTGEIIKGNVTLGSLRVRQDYMIAQGLLSPYENENFTEDQMLKMSLQRLKQLAAHEIGHTLGLMHNYIASTQGVASVMDYPSPVVSVKNGKIDLSNAYTNEIGAWDKVSINYGYRSFADPMQEKQGLDKILKDAAANGLTFISDRDARDPAGAHPDAHLWDQGKDPVSGLKQVMEVRNRALQNFGINSIKNGTPMAFVEDVLVPVYLYHRYQMEAVSRVVGGLYYTYAIKGDGQVVTQPVSKTEQLNALNALIDCLDPKNLLIPDNIIKLIPERPAGYDYGRELFPRRTGKIFDPLAAAESAADMPLSFLFNAGKLDRMVEYQKENGGLGADEMVNKLIEATWKKTPGAGLSGMILQQNQQLLLTYLLASSVSNQTSFATKAVMMNALEELKNNITASLKQNPANKGYLLLTLDRMKNPKDAKPTIHAVPPPGSPIGEEQDTY